jgi:hypothetical protein
LMPMIFGRDGRAAGHRAKPGHQGIELDPCLVSLVPIDDSARQPLDGGQPMFSQYPVQSVETIEFGAEVIEKCRIVNLPKQPVAQDSQLL